MTETLATLRQLEQEYADACESREKAWKDYSELCDIFQVRSKSPEFEAAKKLADELEAKASKIWHAREAAKVAHLEYLASQEQDCDCNPISTCNACAQRAHNSEIEF